MKRIGIDVGGTNTDAVLVEENGVVASVKTPTTRDVIGGVREALRLLVERLGGNAGAVGAVMIGTTHFTNAVVQRRDLAQVAAIRIALPSGRSLPPFVDWPPELKELVAGRIYMVRGGHEYDGRPLDVFDVSAVTAAAREIRDTDIRTVAVTAAFSPLVSDCEAQAAEILRTEIPGVHVTLSHDLGRIGLLERENAALLNAALIPLADKTTRAFSDAVERSGIEAPLFLTQNDGTVMRADRARAYPVYSFSSGPTNSMRGAAFLSELDDAMVVDVGGTTTDIGHLKAGFPREANRTVEVGGVRTLFRMPDLLSLGLGGGSLVDESRRMIGPRSVGHELETKATVFGGSGLTVSDLAVAAGLVSMGDSSRVEHVDPVTLSWFVERSRAMIEEGVDRMKATGDPLPLLAVGGGAFLVPDQLPGISEVIHVKHAPVANAVGAAIAQVSGEVDQVFSGISRAEALAEAEALARSRAVEGGADLETITAVEIEDLPLAYLPGEARRVRVRVVGDALAL
ncbi:MAG TPA: hydantoinase [Gemmatimonadetes bacterium]|nr:hydantoinase [Gemmatimonadota bacterium]|tara:strand:- start:642 stop:2180 length:1539 start_codon:yes stop_codon:yes gene_type:complete